MPSPQTSADRGMLIRTRREQMNMDRQELASCIDVDIDEMKTIEMGKRELTDWETLQVIDRLEISERYLLGLQSLEDVLAIDDFETERMVLRITTAFRNAPNLMSRRAIHDHIFMSYGDMKPTF